MLPSLPNECFSDILSFLDRKSLYNCLFVNKFYCKLSIPIIWRDPFITPNHSKKFPLINTLLACLNEDEISSLIPCSINIINNQSPLFDYGKFVRKIDHGNCARQIIGWLKSSSERDPTNDDCRVQKLVDVIYHMIMRQGSNLQKFVIIQGPHSYIDLPKFSIFTTYKPGIRNLRFFKILGFGDKFQNTVEFLSMSSNFCNSIVDCELWINAFTCTYLYFIKLQPLQRIMVYINNNLDRENVKKIIYALEFRSETLKELSFEFANFRDIDLSFLSKLKYLEQLEFHNCFGFTFHETLSKKKFHLKELKLWDCDMKVAMINYFCGETLLKLSLTNPTLETIKVVKESCPKISFLHMKKIKRSKHLDSIISLICELSSLRILNLNAYCFKSEHVRIFGDYLTSVEYLFLDFLIDLPDFEYFTNNCKANLKKWIIFLDNESLRKDYLICVSNFQKVQNSLKVLGIKIKRYSIFDSSWTSEELEIIDLSKSQGIDIVSYDDVIDDFL